MRRSPRRTPGAGALVLGATVSIAACVWWAGRGDGALVASAEERGECEAAVVAPANAELAPAVAAAAREGHDPEPAAVRVDAVELVSSADPAEVARLVADLRDDDVRGNGLAAFHELCRLPRGRIDALEAALRSRDGQQRTFAGAALRERCEQHGQSPSAALLDESVAALRRGEDRVLLGTGAWPLAATSLRFLVGHVERAREPLLCALEAGDDQQRLFAAYLLANVADERLAPRIVRELAVHLEDNEIGGDAMLAAHGLYRLGATGLPAVRWWHRGIDAQGRSLLALVELDVNSPPRDRQELRARAERHRVTSLYHDPVVEFDLWRSPVPRW